MSQSLVAKPRVKLPINPFLFKLSHNLMYQVALASGACLLFLLLSLYYYLPPMGFAEVWWGIPVGLGLVVITYWIAGTRRRHNLTPVDEVYPEVNDLVVTLAARRFLMCEPPPKVFLTNAHIIAQTWVWQGESYIAVGRHFARRLDQNPQLWSAVLLHEMSHLRNGDIPLRFANILLFLYLSLLILGLGAWGVLWGGSHLIPVEALSLSVIMFLLQLWALLRARLSAETAADLRATLAIGDNRGLLEALRQLRLSRGRWQGRVLEAREAMILNLADSSQQRLGSFLIYGMFPLLAASCLMAGITLFSEGSQAAMTGACHACIAGLLMVTMGLGLYWATHDSELALIALGFRSLLPSLLVLLLGEGVALAVLGFFQPQIPVDQIVLLLCSVLIVLGWAELLLHKEFKSGATIPAVLRWHDNRVLVAGVIFPVLYALLFNILVGAGAIIYCDEVLCAITLTWFLTVGCWLWLESFRYLPHAITPANWSQPIAESPPDRAIDLSAFKPVTREQEIAMGIFDSGMIVMLAGAVCVSLQVLGSVMCGIYALAIVVGFHLLNSGGRRSWGAWLQGATLRTGHRRPVGNRGAALSFLRLLAPSLRGGELDWAAVEEARISPTATLWLGIVFASAGATMLFLRLAEVL